MHRDAQAKPAMSVKSKRSARINCNRVTVKTTNFAIQIRCSGERPSCKRCVRLKNTCRYDTNSQFKRHVTRTTSRTEPSCAIHSSNLVPAASPAHLNAESVPNHGFYLGIAPSLVNTLIELYFDNVYQSTLLLHKSTFMQSLANQTVKAHILLSICAWGAK